MKKGTDDHMALKIPQHQRENTVALINADPRLLDALAKVLPTCPPGLSRKSLAEAVAGRLRDVPVATESAVTAIVSILLALYVVLRVNDSLGAADASAEVVSTFRADSNLGVPPDGWDTFQKRLEVLFSDDAVLGLSAKAMYLSGQNARHVHAVRVLSDARPIFGENAKDGPQAFAVLHTLKIEYFEDGNSRDWFVSLDGDDLESLQGAIERALTKERSAKSMLDKLGIPILTWKTSDGG